MDLMDYRRKIIASSPHLSHAEGAVASFSDGTDLLLKSLIVDIDPVQDLRGQANPYPAGGGINIWDEEWELGEINTNTGVNGTSTTRSRSKNYIPIVPTESYYCHGTAAMYLFFYDENQNYLGFNGTNRVNRVITPAELVNAKDASVSFASAKYMRFRYDTTTINGVSINYPATDTGYHPYSNICPISGWSAANVTGTGKNLLGGLTLGNAIVNAVNNSTYSHLGSDGNGDYVTIKAGSAVEKAFTDGVVKFKESTRYTLILRITRYQTGTNLNSNIKIRYTDGTTTAVYFTTTSATEVVTIARTTTAGKTVKDIEGAWGGGEAKVFYEESGIFEGVLTADQFKPYTGTSIPVYWSRINVWDEEWETGDILTSDGSNSGNVNKIRSKNYIPVRGGQSYYLNIPPIDTSYKKRCFYDKDGVFISGANTRAGVVDVPSNACYMRFATDTNYGGTYNNDISVNYPSTDTNYHPYNGNYLHINQWDEVWETGTLNASGEPQAADNCIRSKNFCPIVGGQQYYLYTPKTDGDSQNRYYAKVVFYDANKQFISGSWENRRVFTAPSNAAYFKIHTNSSTVVYGGTYNYDISINYPATDTSYHPYNEFTVYGCTLNVLTGELTLERQFFELDGNSNVTKGSSGSTQPTELFPYWVTIYIPCNNATTNYSAWRFSHGKCQSAAYDGIFRTFKTNNTTIQATVGTNTLMSTIEDVKTWLQTQKDNGTPLQIVAELATPLTYHLDPQTVRSLVGQNNIFSDTGNLALDYWAHP